MYNVLTDNLFSVGRTDGVVLRASLPQTLQLAVQDRIESFPHLRPHQRPAFHAFLVQLACIACDHAGFNVPPDTADGWQKVLRQLTTTWPDDAPWQLIVNDSSKPALLQPPQPPDAPDLKGRVEQPDKLDMLVTSKNHDLKQRRMAHGAPEDWFFALLSLQTQEGFLGAGNYGVARMNGGFANRSYLTLAPEELRFGGRVFRDINAILSDTEKFYRAADVGSPTGHTLLWLLPWDGTESVRIEDCHPLYIEVCRRVRLGETGGCFHASTGNTKKPRVEAKALAGNVGDPWLPLDIQKEPKAMTLTVGGFDYRRMAQLVTGADSKYQLPYLARPTVSERDIPLAYEAYGMVRGQGKTEGYHSRRVLIPPTVVSFFADPDQREQLASRCKEFLELAGVASGKVLRPALIQLFQGQEDVEWKKPSNEALCRPWLSRMNNMVDGEFFALLFASLPSSQDEAATEFSRYLARLTREVFVAAAEAAPQHPLRQRLARVRAELFLTAALRKHLPAQRFNEQEPSDERFA